LEWAFDEVRESFFDTDPDAVVQRLSALDLSNAPDLERGRKRLLAVNGLRDELRALEQQPKIDGVLLKALRAVLVGSSSVSGSVRENAVRAIASGPSASRGKRFARLVSKRCPGIAALERDWLERIVNARRDRKESRALKNGIGLFGGYVLLHLLIKFVALLMRAFSTN